MTLAEVGILPLVKHRQGGVIFYRG